MRYFSTFSGIGGFEIGIHNAFEATRLLQGIDHTDSSTADIAGGLSSKPLCVGYSEIDKYASSVYQKQFGGTNYGDIRKINAEDLPEFDCLIGGFPCQAFSIAGNRRGFDDTRGTLFFELARILKQKQPRLFVFENVKGLLSHDKGRTLTTIIATIDELGYDCQWQVLNSKNFGVPQNRERIIIVGHLRGTSRPQVFPITSNHEQDIILPTITTRVTADSNGSYVRKVAPQKIIVDSMFEGDGWNKRHESIRRVYNTEGISPTVPIGTGGGVMPKINVGQIRRLTPVECERLQGFPDNWTKFGGDSIGIDDYEISDSQRYKMCGNAVTTNVIQAVFERIFRDEQTL